ncbi:zonular occludens toxin domain-containing protein [Xylella fastidiosa]|uniref:zonular occludens toxin domain-containing protein n=1 Tax=Xylella fastidiosa TaxID=2371 RepID=UPI001F3C55B6|nr:zonular occludens toxin domain-containing protein [Xylella fastidiosa]UIN27770.1 zonular occludens toxin domain-containing protein [Xylella fastidiosa subsp. morus]UIT44486.1 zonular occludens toxin domain-containing protein [Xylella fastidiosa subsp. morus]
MPIHVITALPGGGKTAIMVEMLEAEAKLGARPLFAAGIDGLQPGLATVLDDPSQWNAKDAQGNYIVPDGSLIFVDEAWKWFGMKYGGSGMRQTTPDHVRALAEHRHRGLDFVWTTQQAHKQLYSFVHGLIGRHTFIKRRFGTRFLDVWEWDELVENVNSSSNREFSRHSVRTLPKHVYSLYKSAEIHTIRSRIPLRLLLIPLCAVLSIVCMWYAWHSLRPDSIGATLLGQQSPEKAELAKPVGTAGRSSGAPSGVGQAPRWATAVAYARDHLPRFPSMPWTAPIFDGRSLTADPQLICMSGGEGLDAQGHYKGASCTCYTEQGTLYDLLEAECRRIARSGPVYNPYRERVQDRAAVQQSGLSGPVMPVSNEVHSVSVSSAGALP